MPLFSVVTKEINHDDFNAMDDSSDGDDDQYGPTTVNPKAKDTKKAKSRRTKKSKKPERNLISRLVDAMDDVGAPVHAESGDEEIFSAENLPMPEGGFTLLSGSDEEGNNRTSATDIAAEPVFDVGSEGVVERRDSMSLGLAQAASTAKDSGSEAEYVEQTKSKKKSKKAKSKTKTTKAGRRTKKSTESSTTPGGWRGRAPQPKFGSMYDDDDDDGEPAIYEVNATVIRGRNRNAPARRPSTAISEEDDEIINITDVTSDASGGFPSETEFDRPDTTGEMFAQRHEWSDSNMLGDDSNLEQEEERYLAQISDSDFSSSSLSDLDDARLAALDSEMFSGDEGDTESDYSESDEELNFRQPQNDRERALQAQTGSDDEREEAMLEMHLDQLHAVRSVIGGYSSPVLEHAGESDTSEGEVDREITFTYDPSRAADSDSDARLSDDLMEGWGPDARMRWELDSDGSSDSSSLSESKIDKLRLKDEDEESDVFSSDSYDAYDDYYARDSYMDDTPLYPGELDIDSASLALGVAMSMEQQGYSKEDAEAAAAVAAVTAAAYPDASANGDSADDILDKRTTTTIIASMNANGEADPIDGIVSIKSRSAGGGGSGTAARSGFMSPAGMRTGAHTPFGNPGWRAAASAFLDGQKPQPTVSYVLPKDLNEARDPNVVASVMASTVNTGEARNTPEPVEIPASFANPSGQNDDSAIEAEDALTTPVLADESKKPKPASSASPGHFNNHLPNSSFYKPLSSICTPLSRTTASSNAGQSMNERSKSDGASPASTVMTEKSEVSVAAPVPAPATSSAAVAAAASVAVADFCSGTPLVSLAEVNAALTALAEQV
ncbi:hypothetical protein FBU59_003037, partial [Linderina macrospora]